MPNIHPLIVQFPIVLLILAFISEFYGRIRNDRYFLRTGKYGILLGTVSLGAAVLSGWIAHKTVPHTESSYQFIEQHQMMGFIALAIFIGLLLYRFLVLEKPDASRSKWIIFLILNLIGVLLMSYGAHLGGNLVFEHGIGVKSVEEKMSQGHQHHDHKGHHH